MRSGFWPVLKREYGVRVRSRWFLFATVAAPLLLLALTLVPLLLEEPGGGESRRVLILDRTGRLAPGVAERLEALGVPVTGWEGPGGDLDALERRVAGGGADVLAVLDDESLARGRMTLHARGPIPLGTTAALRQAVVQTALELRLGGDREGVTELLSGGAVEVVLLEGGGAPQDDPRFVTAYVGAFLLYMVLLFYAVAVLRSVLEEKTSRMVEIVVSSVRPFHLMLGKIVGVGAVGLTQLAVWLMAGALLLRLAGPLVARIRPGWVPPEGLSPFLPGGAALGLFVVFFLGGYFIYSGLYAAVGAMCSTDEEAQQAQFPVILLLAVPILFVAEVIQDPGSSLSTTLSFVPFFTPVLMFARAVVGGAAPWEIALSVALMGATILAVAWGAGRIYRVGILLTGKRPTPLEILRWIREP